jgi:hypothetical protein
VYCYYIGFVGYTRYNCWVVHDMVDVFAGINPQWSNVLSGNGITSPIEIAWCRGAQVMTGERVFVTNRLKITTGKTGDLDFIAAA